MGGRAHCAAKYHGHPRATMSGFERWRFIHSRWRATERSAQVFEPELRAQGNANCSSFQANALPAPKATARHAIPKSRPAIPTSAPSFAAVSGASDGAFGRGTGRDAGRGCAFDGLGAAVVSDGRGRGRGRGRRDAGARSDAAGAASWLRSTTVGRSSSYSSTTATGTAEYGAGTSAVSRACPRSSVSSSGNIAPSPSNGDRTLRGGSHAPPCSSRRSDGSYTTSQR